jgi:hypothetical protein
MRKRFQVFVSSTYTDLQDERRAIQQTLLSLQCIPSGMELFPAANEDPWTLIQGVIDDCDYYLLVLAGRYGSMDEHGVSYTEKEYRYALEKGKPVMVFIHKNPEQLPSDRSERDPESQRKLSDFRKLVQKHTCQFWDSSSPIASLISPSLNKMINDHPSVGWVHGSKLLETEEKLSQITKKLREQEELVEKELSIRDYHSAHLALEKNIISYLDQCRKENTVEPRVSITVMAISMVFSWVFLRERVPEFLDNHPSLRIDLKLLWVDPDLLQTIAMSRYGDINWLETSQRRLQDTRDFLDLHPACRERLTLQARTYKNLPHWHGILFNAEHLYLGRVNWSFPVDDRPKLSCGRNKYRYFNITSDMGKERIDLFNNWCEFYTNFSSVLIYDSNTN